MQFDNGLDINRLQLSYVSRSIVNPAMFAYVLALCACSMLYPLYMLKWYWWIFGLVEVLGFFYFVNYYSKRWQFINVTSFKHKLFYTALVIRVVYVLFSYYFYILMTDIPFEMGTADAWIYHKVSEEIANSMRNGDFNLRLALDKAMGSHVSFSDSGYPIYLSFIYYLSFDSILIARIVKSILSACSIVLIYNIATRNFGDVVGRVAAILCLLMPNLIYYCGLHLKETEMLFLVLFAIDRADQILHANNKIKWIELILAVIALSSFRTVLACVAVLAVLLAFVLYKDRFVKRGRYIYSAIILIAFVGLFLLNQTEVNDEVNVLWNVEYLQQQQTNMEWRSQRDGGNSQRFAKYASAVVFAPMIFSLPFPTMTETPEQENQKMINGGNFVKNIMSYFTIMTLIVLLISGNWRKFILLEAFLCGYLLVLAFSNFAHSERFHLPVLPFIMMFAAYGICNTYKYPKIRVCYRYWCVWMFLIAVAWNWFKLAGRGFI